jgi:hypothetical protein
MVKLKFTQTLRFKGVGAVTNAFRFFYADRSLKIKSKAISGRRITR